MTWFLVENEYITESSSIHQLPIEYLSEKFLHYENNSTLKISWKGETIGGISIQVLPKLGPTLRGTSRLVVPLLGQRPKVRMDWDLKMKSGNLLDHLQLNGRFDDVVFNLTADSATGKMNLKVVGNGINETREFPLSENLAQKSSELLSQTSSLPMLEPTQFKDYQLQASSVRVFRHDDWMDAYLLEARIDANSWFKLWMSPSGELLKADSSFGLSAINEEFFDEIPIEKKQI